MRNKKGITLIALVITIIVLLILAAVSIQAITGDNGIATKAKTAKEQSEIGTEKEQIRLSYSSCKLDKIEDLNEEITALELENKMNESYGEGTVEVQGSGLLAVKYLDTERIYLVLANGNTVVEADSIVENLTYENSVGIAEDGSLVDMTLWKYEYGYDYSGKEWYAVGDSFGGSYVPPISYYGEIHDGKIEGEVPAYILDLRYSEEFLPVKSFTCVFANCEELEYAPKLPSTITDMTGAYYRCVNLKETPSLPQGMINMNDAFFGCKNLLEAPDVPDTVITMSSTFGDCEKIEKAPKIPEGVTKLSSTFIRCRSLVEAPIIPNGVISMSNTFTGCYKLAKAPVIPNNVTSLDGTFSGCISLTEAPVIPDSVTNMSFTFSECTNLVKAPIIPKNVTNMQTIFSGCSSLTGDLIINANPTTTYCRNALMNVATNEGCDLVLSGSSTMLNTILATKSASSNIRIGN